MIHVGDCLEILQTMPSDSVDCIVTSPPYWGLRDYGVEGQIGLEPDFREYLAKLVEVFEECRRVLKPSGTCWVNMGDGYNAGTSSKRKAPKTFVDVGGWNDAEIDGGARLNFAGLKPKDLIGQPWRLAFALQDAGWYLRSDIIWHKPNPMPESVRDRPTKAHEYLFLLTKSQRYYYDADAIAEPSIHAGTVVKNGSDRIDSMAGTEGATRTGFKGEVKVAETRNVRSVWTIPTVGFKEAHFATFPPEMPNRCILAGCPEGGTVLDPFAGAGTTLMVAKQLGRKWIGIELNPEYAMMATRRVEGVTGSLFMEDA